MTNAYSVTDSAAEGVLFGIGNPLLDISAKVDASWLEKYGLDSNSQILADEGGKHDSLYPELLKQDNCELLPGGATLNTIRATQWVIQQAKNSQGATAYSGSVNGGADDQYRELLDTAVKAAGVNSVYHMHQGAEPTGTCACVITGNEGHRSLVANLAAANKYTADAVKSGAIHDALKAAKYVYSAGFFLTTEGGPKAMEYMSAHCNEDANKKILAINLSAPFLSMFFKDTLNAAIDGADVVFGNEAEIEAWGTSNGVCTEDEAKQAAENGGSEALRKKIVKAIAERPRTHSNQKPRLVICTQGCDNTLAYANGQESAFEVTALPKDQIVDTNGAGDAFVAGFLAGLIYGKDLQGCANVGNFCARQIIQQAGCTFPATADFPKF